MTRDGRSVLARPWLRWLLATLAAALVVHVIAIRLLPVIVMRVASNAMASVSGSNVPVFPPRADDTARTIVRPSPDLLYAGCAFDLSQGPLRIRAEVPPDTYWSLSMFAANTDNFFVVNDRQVGSSTIDLVLATEGSAVEVPAGARLVESPSTWGIVLTRTLVASEQRAGELDDVRRRFSCAPLS